MRVPGRRIGRLWRSRVRWKRDLTAGSKPVRQRSGCVFLEAAIGFDGGEQILEQDAMIGHQAESAAGDKRLIGAVKKGGRDHPVTVKLRAVVGVGKVGVHLPQRTWLQQAWG